MVIDSHALLWWLDGGERLSAKASELLGGVGQGQTVFFVSAITFWELRLKERRGQLAPKRPIGQWPDVLRRTADIELVDVSPEIWLATADLAWEQRDPADRVIAATALHLRVPVLTKDRMFHAPDAPVKAVW